MQKVVLALLLCSYVITCDAINRIHYIACVEEEWNYAPSGKNMLNGQLIADDPKASIYLSQGPDRIGSRYKKAIYYEFTDDTYTVRVPKPDWQGTVGPILKGETNDVIHVYFKNLCSRGYSMHPHGVFYTKDSEGAFYHDNTAGSDKSDDDVPPGGSHHYEWIVDADASPHGDDPNCLSWVYHSHVDSPKDTNSGLVGIIITCKPGTLDANGNRTDVSHEFVLLMTIMDENQSWYLDENIQTYCLDPATVDKESADFIESNQMNMINGYLYGNLPDIKVCVGETVAWYVLGMGTEIDILSIYFHGQNLVYAGHRTDVIAIYPAIFTTSHMTAINPGIWMVKCVTSDRYDAGMAFLFDVKTCAGASEANIHGLTDQIREYFIQAEEVYWDYGPTGLNNYFGGSLTEPGSSSATYFETGAYRIGGVYEKIIYVEYTDATFTTKKARAPEEEYMGLLGPAIKAEVGDQIRVTFKNNASRPYTIHPHGVFYDKANEGAGYDDGTSGLDKDDDGVAPGDSYVYDWSVPLEWAPTFDDGNCSTYMYYSHVEPTMDQFTGLIGPLIVCKAGMLNQYGVQAGVTREVYLYYSIIDENKSWYIDDNIQDFCGDPAGVVKDDPDFILSNQMHGVNGFLYANMPNLAFCIGDVINIHIMNLGSSANVMGVHFHGNTLLWNNNHADTVPVEPGVFRHAFMTPDNEGEWGIVCRDNPHYDSGMQAKYNVNSCAKVGENRHIKQEIKAVIRVYYIGAVELEWDYAPNGYNGLTNGSLYDPDSHGYTFAHRGNTTIGHQYKKVVFREFTDETFTQEVQRTSQDQHLEVLGPFIKAEIGDTLQVHFKNMASRDYSVHPHGLLYHKVDEGSPYEDGSTSPGDAVKPGQSYTYKWEVPARAGPSAEDPNCITWMYYSAVDPVKDTNSGLIGPLIVCRAGILDANSTRTDVDREFALLFSVLDENESWYLDENIQTYCYTPGQVNKEDGDFQESNLMHGVNGKIYVNVNGIEMYLNERVDWYLLSLGSEVDMHTIHFHGDTFIHQHGVGNHRDDVYDLFPGVGKTVSTIAENVGEWLLHCHVNDHIHAGMEVVYKVLDPVVQGQSGISVDASATSISGYNSATGLFSLVALIFLFI